MQEAIGPGAHHGPPAFIKPKSQAFTSYSPRFGNVTAAARDTAECNSVDSLPGFEHADEVEFAEHAGDGGEGQECGGQDDEDSQ